MDLMDLAEKARLLKNKIDTLASQGGGTVEGLDDFIKGCPYLQGFVGDASGNVTSIYDVATISQELDIAIKGRNKVALPYASESKEYTGMQINVQEDGSIVCNGTTTAPITFNLVTSANAMKWDIIKPSDWQHIEHIYRVGLAYEGEYSDDDIQLTINYYYEGSTSYTSWKNAKIGKAFIGNLPYNIKGLRIYITIPANTTATNLVLKPYIIRVSRDNMGNGWGRYVPSLENYQDLIVRASDETGNIQTATLIFEDGVLKAKGIYATAKVMDIEIAGNDNTDHSLAAEVRYYRA